ncbi:MAG TPA: acyl-CoA thioesterase [Candidatus Polarisedimenticolia bacterium]|nr:acyl-CoA thioesterase [Candidatus Polarisedimenticolia bacterium]
MSARSAKKPVSESRVEMTEIVLPEDTNQYGHAWGGRVMTLIDKAAAIASVRHCRSNVVTASVDSLVFRAPVKLGHILRLYASVNAAFHSSMEIGVKVVSEDPLSSLQAHCCSAFVTMVALDATGRPTPVPGLLPESSEDRRRQRDAARRRRARLAVRAGAQRRSNRPR